MERSLCGGRMPYPPGSRRRERPNFESPRCGGRKRPPYGAGETRRPPGKMQFPRPLQTHVGDDARTAPAGAFRRPTGPQVRLLGRRSSQGVCGDAGFGRGMPLPYTPSGDDRPNGIAASARANVGRDALVPPGPAAGQGSAGGINPAPTGKFCVPGKPGGRDVCPGLQGRATALPQGSAAGQAGPIWNRPLHGVFAAAGMFPVLNRQRCGGRERPPYGPRETRRPTGKMQSPRHTVGADSISARFTAARVRGRGTSLPYMPSGNDRPKRDCHGRPGERRAGCPHPAGPRGSAGFRGRDKSRPYGQILCSRQTGRPRCLPRFAGEGHGPPAGVRGRAGRADMESAPTWVVCGGAGFRGRDKSRPYE